jgi:hypothetical protein
MRARTQVGGRYAALATLRLRLAARSCLQHADQVAAREPDQTVIERALARPISGTAPVLASTLGIQDIVAGRLRSEMAWQTER